ncbi:copper chaperone PCu(A)C [Embleya scabrispora]|uniref:copper chaperone PCu(A)C n=1 Tax=Embleya scabrispora TaxID=159449 RepID=UPI00036BD16F|nr:copper chaperone PCu(A)C [Embleya scabrispora]
MKLFPLPRKAVPLAVGGVLALGIGGVLVACAGSGSSDSADRKAAAPANAGAAKGAPQLRIVDPYIPQPSSADVAAGYLIVQNDGDTADRLLSVASPLSGEVMLHQTSGNSMQHVPGLDVPAHGKGVLARGGNHIMFMSPNKAVKKGDTVPLTLTFQHTGPVTVQVPVLGVTERPGDAPTAGTPASTAPGGAAPAPETSSAAPAADHPGHAGH